MDFVNRKDYMIIPYMKNGKYVPKHQPGCHVDQPGVTDIGDMD
jgi:hypothetical protein